MCKTVDVDDIYREFDRVKMVLEVVFVGQEEIVSGGWKMWLFKGSPGCICDRFAVIKVPKCVRMWMFTNWAWLSRIAKSGRSTPSVKPCFQESINGVGFEVFGNILKIVDGILNGIRKCVRGKKAGPSFVK